MKMMEMKKLDLNFLFRSSTPKGQSISEYGLALSLIGLVSIASLVFLGQTAGNTLPAFFNTLYGIENNSGGNPGGNGLVAQGNPNNGLPNGNTIPITLTLENGDTLNLQYPNDLLESIETTGANGSTEALAGVIDQILAQMDGKLSPEDEDYLKTLAKQGHRMASYQRAIESTLASNQSILDSGDVNAYKALLGQRDIAFEGKDYTLQELAASIGVLQYYGAPVDATKPVLGDEMAKLWQLAELRKQLQSNSVVLKDPAVSKVVETLSGQILILADATKNGVMLPAYDPTLMSKSFAERMNGAGQLNGQIMKPALENNSGSLLSHAYAGGICNLGGHEDDGIQCH